MPITNTLVLLILAALAAAQYDAVLSELIRNRLAVVATNIGKPFQAKANLGLPPGTSHNTSVLLEHLRQDDTNIVNLDVYDSTGHIVRPTATSPPPAIPDAVLRTHTSGNIREIATRSLFLVAATFRSIAGEEIGGVVIDHARTGMGTSVRAMMTRLGLIAAMIPVACLALGAVVVRIALAGHMRILDAAPSRSPAC